MSYDIDAVRGLFPALAEGAAHFDAPGGTQTPVIVADAVSETLRSAVANVGTVTRAERRAGQIVAQFRAAMGDLLGADPRGIVYGRSATALTYDLGRALSRDWGPGDEVVVTRLDHDANVRPWVQLAQSKGATVRWVDFDPRTGELPADAVAEVLTDRTRLVATTAASNLIGTKPPVCKIGRAVHEVGAIHWVDGVHATAHESVDVEALGADVWTCSPYKFLGPHCGVAAVRPSLLAQWHPDKLLPSPEQIPERFELGTLPYEFLAGSVAAVETLAWLAETAAPVPRYEVPSGQPDWIDRRAEGRRERILAGMAALHAHEEGLRERLDAQIRALPGARVYSNAGSRTPTMLFGLDGRDPQDVRTALAKRGVNAPASHFYAIECSRHLGLGDHGAVRVGLAPYTSADDVDRLIGALREIA
ncbi:cysteine desulfurase-like protein [Janibacter sp. GXQ6167]|uniref:cysteine desulfurase-like protein n=1 Tax=Janibacter sp. GXQ6167 TaxID=3240791 RepID=UPI00352618ED